MKRNTIAAAIAAVALVGCGRTVDVRVIENREPRPDSSYFVTQDQHCLVEDVHTGQRYLLRFWWGEPGDEFRAVINTNHGGRVLVAGG